MVLTKKILAQLEQKHNIKFTSKQAAYMDLMFGRYIRPDWRMHDFERGLRIALLLYPSPKQQPFFDQFHYEQLKLDHDEPDLP